MPGTEILSGASRTTKTSAHIEVTPVPPKQQSILANLFELYAHDFSEFNVSELGADGSFGYSTLAFYWQADMVGTTRSQICFFMNRFKKLGFIYYEHKSKLLRVNQTLLVFRDQ